MSRNYEATTSNKHSKNNLKFKSRLSCKLQVAQVEKNGVCLKFIVVCRGVIFLDFSGFPELPPDFFFF